MIVDPAGGGRARFFEPGGITAGGGRLFVADTNNHAVRIIEIATGDVTTLPLARLGPPGAWSYLRRWRR